MKLEYTFKHVDASEALTNYLNERLEKMLKFEMKPMDVQVVFSMHRHECTTDISVLEGRRKYKAHATADDFYRSVDMVTNKLIRQLSKGKRRVREHKNIEASDVGKLARLTPELEFDYSRVPKRKAG